jgi:hypothetical protein
VQFSLLEEQTLRLVFLTSTTCLKIHRIFHSGGGEGDQTNVNIEIPRPAVFPPDKLQEEELRGPPRKNLDGVSREKY